MLIDEPVLCRSSVFGRTQNDPKSQDAHLAQTLASFLKQDNINVVVDAL